MSKTAKVLIGFAIFLVCGFVLVAAVSGYFVFRFNKTARSFNEGVVAVNRNDYDTAAVKFKAALKDWPDPKRRAYALTVIGFSEEKNGECEKALQDYSRAIQIDPGSELPYGYRGEIFRDAGKLDEAFKDFSEAIRLDPNYHSALFGRGLIDLERKDLDQAIEDFSEAARTNPSSADSYRNRGLAYTYKRDFEQALVNFDAALGLNAKDASALANRGWVYVQKKEFAKAIPDLTASIRIEPSHGPTYRTRALAYQRQGDYIKAIADFEQLLRLVPTDVSTLNDLAWLRATCPNAAFRDGKQAVSHATKACTISEWRYATEVDTLAAAYAEAGDFKSAVSYEEQAIRCDTVIQERIGEMEQRKALYLAHKPYREVQAQN